MPGGPRAVGVGETWNLRQKVVWRTSGVCGFYSGLLLPILHELSYYLTASIGRYLLTTNLTWKKNHCICISVLFSRPHLFHFKAISRVVVVLPYLLPETICRSFFKKIIFYAGVFRFLWRCPLSTYLLTKAAIMVNPVTIAEEYKKMPNLKEDDLNALRDWCLEQRHLPHITGEYILLILTYLPTYLTELWEKK